MSKGVCTPTKVQRSETKPANLISLTAAFIEGQISRAGIQPAVCIDQRVIRFLRDLGLFCSVLTIFDKDGFSHSHRRSSCRKRLRAKPPEESASWPRSNKEKASKEDGLSYRAKHHLASMLRQEFFAWSRGSLSLVPKVLLRNSGLFIDTQYFFVLAAA
jgi:hypothetical protein